MTEKENYYHFLRVDEDIDNVMRLWGAIAIFITSRGQLNAYDRKVPSCVRKGWFTMSFEYLMERRI